MKLRILAFIMAAIMTFNTIPVTAFATETETAAEELSEESVESEEAEILEETEIPEETSAEESAEVQTAEIEKTEEVEETVPEENVLPEEPIVEESIEEESTIIEANTGEAVEMAEGEPSISCTLSPANTIVTVGGEKTLTAEFEGINLGEEELSYQWYRCEADSTETKYYISNADSNTYVVPTEFSGTTYYVCEASAYVGDEYVSAESDIVEVIVTDYKHIYEGRLVLYGTAGSLEEDGWAYDADTKTLTVNDLYIYSPSDYGIYAYSDITIKTEGKGIWVDSGTAGIYSRGTIELCGTGTHFYSSHNVYTIRSLKNITITEGTRVLCDGSVYASGEFVLSQGSTMVLNDISSSYGLEVNSFLIEDENSSLTICCDDSNNTSSRCIYATAGGTIRDKAELILWQEYCTNYLINTNTSYATRALTLDLATLTVHASNGNSLFNGVTLDASDVEIILPENGTTDGSKVYDSSGKVVSEFTFAPRTDEFIKIVEQSEPILSKNGNEELTLSVKAEIRNSSSANKAVSYQWYTCDFRGNNGKTIQGATTDTYTVSGEGAQFFYCVVSADGLESVKTELISVISSKQGKTVVTEDLNINGMESIDRLEAEGWAWDSQSNVLTLQDFTAVLAEIYNTTAIYLPENAKVVLKGDNIIYREKGTAGFSIEGTNLTLTGEGEHSLKLYETKYFIKDEGSLLIEAANVSFYSSSESIFISAEENFKLLGCEVAEGLSFKNSGGSNYYISGVDTAEIDIKPYLSFSEKPENRYEADVENLPTLTMKAVLKGTSDKKEIEYEWYQCNLDGSERVLAGTGEAYSVPQIIGASYYVGVAKAAGVDSNETDIIAVFQTPTGMKINTETIKTQSIAAMNPAALKESGWYFNPSTKTLYLENYAGIMEPGNPCFRLPVGASIVISGENYIYGTQAFLADGTLNISGDGKIKAEYSVESGLNSVQNLIDFSGELTISDVTLDIEHQGDSETHFVTLDSNDKVVIDGAKLDILTDGDAFAYNSAASGQNITIQNQAQVTVSSGANAMECNALVLDNAMLESYAGFSAVAADSILLKNSAMLKCRHNEKYSSQSYLLDCDTLNVGSGCTLDAFGSSFKPVVTVNTTAQINGDVFVNSNVKGNYGSFYAKSFTKGKDCVISVPENGYWDYSTGYMMQSAGKKATDVRIFEGGCLGEITSIGDITGDFYVDGILTAGEVDIKDADVQYQWRYLIDENGNSDVIWGGTKKQLDLSKIHNPSLYVGKYVFVEATGDGKYLGTARSNPVLIKGSPCRLAENVVINGKIVTINPDATNENGYASAGTIYAGYKDTEAEVKFFKNDGDTEITINGIKRDSYLIKDLSKEDILKVTVSKDGKSNHYRILVKQADPPETSTLTLKVNATDLSSIDKIIAEWTTPDGTTDTETAYFNAKTVSAEVPYNSKVRVYTVHNTYPEKYPNIRELDILNDEDGYDYNLSVKETGTICGCATCDNAYEFTMDSGDVTFELENEHFVFVDPVIIDAQWDNSGNAVFDVSMGDGTVNYPVDSHNTSCYKEVTLYLTDENGEILSEEEGVSFKENPNSSVITLKGDSTKLTQTRVTIAAADVDPDRDYYVKAVIGERPFESDLYQGEVVKLASRNSKTISDISFNKTLLDDSVLLYNNGIITIKDTVTIPLEFDVDEEDVSKVKCTVTSSNPDAIKAAILWTVKGWALELTPISGETEYIYLTASLYGQAISEIWRVNYTSEGYSIRNAKLESKTVTVNPAKSDYATIQILTDIPDDAKGISWKFVGQKAELLNDCFALVQIDGHTLEIRPKWDGINALGGISKLSSSYKNLQLHVERDSDGVKESVYIVSALTLKIDKKMPSVKASAVKLNSFYTQAEAPIKFTAKDAAISKVEIDTTKAGIKGNANIWADVYWNEESAQAIVKTITDVTKVSGKLYLNVYLEGYSEEAPIPVTVSVSAAVTAPKLKLSSTSLTLTDYASKVSLQVLSANKKFALEDTGITGIRIATEKEIEKLSAKEQKTYAITSDYRIIPAGDFKETGKFALQLRNQAAAGKILIYGVIGNDDTQVVPLSVTVKTSAKPTVKMAKSSLTMNVLSGSDFEQKVAIITSHSNWSLAYAKVRILDKSGKEVNDHLQANVLEDERCLVVSVSEECVTGSYKVQVTLPGIAKAAVLNVKVQKKLPTLSLSKKALTINTLTTTETNVILSSKDAGFEKLDYTNTKIVVKQNGLIVGEAVDVPGEDHKEVAGLDKMSVKISSVEEQLYLDFTVNEACNEAYTIECSYLCNDGSYTKPVTLKLNLQAKLPTIKLGYKEVKLQSDQDNTYFTLPITCSPDFRYPSPIRISCEVTDTEGNPTRKVHQYGSNSESILFATEELEEGEVFTVVIKCYADKVSGKEQTLKIRVVDETFVPSVACTLKGEIDLSKKDSGTILITPKYKNFMFSNAVGSEPNMGYRIYVKNGKSKADPIDGFIDETGRMIDGYIVYSYGTHLSLEIEKKSIVYKENLYNANWQYYLKPVIFVNGNEYYGKEVKLNIKQSAVKVNQSVKTVNLCSGDKYDREYVKISLNGDGWENIRDIQLAPGSAAGYDIVYYGNGLCAIKFKDNVPTTKGGTVKLNIFLDGVTSEGTKPKANATASVSVKINTVK